MIKIKRTKTPWESLPKGYGCAYRLMDQELMVIYPIPLNLIVSFFRDVYFFLIRPRNKYNTALLEAYSKGYDNGYITGLNSQKEYNLTLIKEIMKGKTND